MLLPCDGIRLQAAACSQAGPVRQSNEDLYLVDEQLGLFVVADGMGGAAAGEIASRLAVESVENFIRRSVASHELSWPSGIDATLTFDGNRLRTAIFLANRRVFREAEAHDDYIGMGTTLVCGLITGNRLTIGHVGDSRLYVYSQGALVGLTQDDTWAATILAGAGQSDSASTSGHPMQHVLTSAIGVRDRTEIHIADRAIAAGDSVLLCSDGVHNVLSDAALTTILADGAGADADTLATRVVEAAVQNGTRDNVTALVVRCLGAAANHGQ